MKKLLLIGALWLLAGCATTSRSHDAEVAEIKRRADAWDLAIVRKDAAAIADNMTDDFRQIDPGGGLNSRQDFIDSLLSPKLLLHPYTVDDFDVRLHGDTALVYGRTRMTGSYDGKPFNSHYRYIDVYVKRGGVWRVASVQITPIR